MLLQQQFKRNTGTGQSDDKTRLPHIL